MARTGVVLTMEGRRTPFEALQESERRRRERAAATDFEAAADADTTQSMRTLERIVYIMIGLVIAAVAWLLGMFLPIAVLGW